MDTPDQPPPPPAVPDLRHTPLKELIADPGAQTDTAVGRVLDLEADGLLTVASFNATI